MDPISILQQIGTAVYQLNIRAKGCGEARKLLNEIQFKLNYVIRLLRTVPKKPAKSEIIEDIAKHHKQEIWQIHLAVKRLRDAARHKNKFFTVESRLDETRDIQTKLNNLVTRIELFVTNIERKREDNPDLVEESDDEEEIYQDNYAKKSVNMKSDPDKSRKLNNDSKPRNRHVDTEVQWEVVVHKFGLGWKVLDLFDKSREKDMIDRMIARKTR